MQKIIDRMEKGAANTPQDNNKRFRRALAERIPTFKKALEHFEQGQFMLAIDTSKAADQGEDPAGQGRLRF